MNSQRPSRKVSKFIHRPWVKASTNRGPLHGKEGSSNIRGALVNTSQAVCSIYESGRMVYRCIQDAGPYTLDYLTLDDLEITCEGADARFTIRAESSCSADLDTYDFWVFNYHPYTMAPHLPMGAIEALKGKTFAIVLELEPDNPIKHAPQHGFDGYMVFDPTALETDTINPLPRPLDGVFRQPKPTVREVPIIGSFGFGTPGKGFELIVDAINQEFDKAKLRVNIPRSSYCDDTMFTVHRCNYASYVGEVSKRIAKPGIEVEFTSDFMTPEALIDWCEYNDLNFFMYSRRQSGLSATTDQAVMSGRPLLVSSNDTFRHIHKYIDPYPLLSLREAMQTTVPAVHRIQEDWSPKALGVAFVEMLKKYELLESSEQDAESQSALYCMPSKPAILVATPRLTHAPDPAQYETRLVAGLGRTNQYEVVHGQCDAVSDVEALAFWHDPAGVLLTDIDSLEPNLPLQEALRQVEGQVFSLQSGQSQKDETGVTPIAQPPIIPYYTALPAIQEGPPRVLLIGYWHEGAALEQTIALVQQDRPDAKFFIALPGTMRDEDKARLEHRLDVIERHLLISWAGERPSLVSLPEDANHCIHLFGSYSLLLFHDVPAERALVRDLCDMALTTERAVAFTRNAPVKPYDEHCKWLEESGAASLIGEGIGANVRLYNTYSEGALFANIASRLKPANMCTAMPTIRGSLQGAVRHMQAPHPNAVVNAAAQAWYEAALECAFSKDEERLAPEPLASFTAQQGFLLAAVDRLCRARPQAKVCCFGDETRPCVTALRKLGYTVDCHISPPRSPRTGYDMVIGANALPAWEEAEEVLQDALALLVPGGDVAFTFYFRGLSGKEDPRENRDFPSVEAGHLLTWIKSVGVRPHGLPRWRVERPVLYPDPFSPPPLATLLLRRP